MLEFQLQRRIHLSTRHASRRRRRARNRDFLGGLSVVPRLQGAHHSEQDGDAPRAGRNRHRPAAPGPRASGRGRIALMRSFQHSSVPMIVVTGRSEPVDRIIEFGDQRQRLRREPFDVRSCAARVRSVLRRTIESPAGHAAADAVRFRRFDAASRCPPPSIASGKDGRARDG